MGFVDKLRAELIDIIEWVDDSRHTLVWRFPRYHNQIKHGAKLIVRPGQLAVFVHQGRIADVFEPGTHRLETRNLPVLSTLAGWMHGFDSPFKAEVYFVSTRHVTELKWGTPNPVIVRDPDFGPIRLRAFGTYSLRAQDPKALLRELVGTDQSFDAEEIGVLMRSIIANAFAELAARSELSVVDLATHYRDLSEKLRRAVLERVDDEYGLDVPQLDIVNVSVPEEVEKAIDARAGAQVVGDMGVYHQYQMGRAIPVAAENPAGGLAGAGVGVGMGAAFAGQMLGGGGTPGPGAPAPAATPPPPPPAPQWHVAENGQAHGPLSPAQLGAAIAAGRITRTTPVWSAGMAGWAPAGTVAELAPLFPPDVPGAGA